jgi:hypothetical protein
MSTNVHKHKVRIPAWRRRTQDWLPLIGLVLSIIDTALSIAWRLLV